MSVLKKKSVCQHCGCMMDAGTEIKWEAIKSMRADSIGRLYDGRKQWVPIHASYDDCQKAKLSDDIKHIELAMESGGCINLSDARIAEIKRLVPNHAFFQVVK